MRRGDQYLVGEGDDILARENAIHSDIDMRLDNVEDQLDAAKDGNRVDLDLLIKRYNDTVAELALRVEDLLDLAKSSISASIITETTTRQFLTPARRQAILDELRGDVVESANTLGELYNLIQGYATPTDLAEAIAGVTDNAPAGRNTFGKLSTALDALAAKVAALTQGAGAARDTFAEVSTAIDGVSSTASAAALNATTALTRLSVLTLGAPSSRDTLLELSNAIDALAATVAALTSGASASRDTFAEVGTALDALAAADGLRLRVDAAQAFSEAQKDQAASNIGLNERYARLDGANLGPFGSRNRFVNGNFEVWQRGTSLTLPSTGTTGRYICDMVQTVFNGTGATMTFDRWIDEDTLRPRLRIQTGTVPTDANTNILRFYIEGVRTMAGRRVAVSCVLKKFGTGADFSLGAAPGGSQLFVRQQFGTGGSPSGSSSATIVSSPADVVITATERRLTWIVDLPSVAGKVLGTNGDDNIQLQLYFPPNVAFKALIGEVQVEEVKALGGNAPTPFAVLNRAEYLALCQRYYEKSYNADDAPASLVTGGVLQQRAQAATSTLTLGAVRFAVAKRAVPAVTLYNPSTGATASPVRNTTAGTDLAGSASNIGSGGFTASIAAAVAAGDAASVHWTADASF